jgi:hypothetical protein
MKTLLKPQLINQAINNNRIKLGLARPFFTKFTSLEGTGEKAKSFVQSILHGAPEVVKEFEKDTFSKLLARGKAINEVQCNFFIINLIFTNLLCFSSQR